MELTSSALDRIMDHNRDIWGDQFSLYAFPERMACIQNGDPDLLADLITQQHEATIAYYTDALQDKSHFAFLLPYFCGSVFTTACAAGLPLERGAAISTYYMTKSSDMDSVEDFVRCTDELMLIFAQEVHRHLTYHTGHQAVDRCLTYIYEHIDQPIRLADLSRACGYSVPRLQHIFPRYTGVTVTDYIRREKVKKAKFLLDHTDLSCAAVGQKLSFCSQSYFIKTFKKETGQTPTQYKAASKGK